MTLAYRIDGALELGALDTALTALVARHEALRTTFPIVDGARVQRVAPASAPRYPRGSDRPPMADARRRSGRGRRGRRAVPPISRAGRCSAQAWSGSPSTSTCSASACTTSSPTAGRCG
jgi:hypothetical protein